MKLDNLEVGMVVKNYKELCRLLEISVRSGSQKIRDVKELDSWIKYDRKGNSYIITEIFSEQKPILDGRGLSPKSHNNQRGAYGKYIRLLILNMLSQGEDENNPEKVNVIHSGRNEMLEKLNMINENYRHGSYNRKAMSHYLGMDIEFIHEFYNTNTQKMRNAVDATLNRLMNSEKLIFWNSVKMIGKYNEHREATDEEIETIINCERETLLEMGTNKMDYIYASNRLDEFYIRVKNKLNKENILFSYNGYKIIFSDDVYKRNEQLKYKLGINEVKINESELNEKVFVNFTRSMKNRHTKTKNEAQKRFLGKPSREWLNQNNAYKNTIIKDEFVGNSILLAEICIDQTYQDICEEISQSWREFRKREEIKTKKEFDEIIEELMS